jgi:probable rRNA maturation factor
MIPKRGRRAKPAPPTRAARAKQLPSATLGVALQNPRGYRDVGPKALEAWLRKLVAALAPKAGSLAARLTSDAEVRRLNRRFRGKDKPTDVLSFPGETTADGYHVGDIVISVPTARRQAAEAEHTLARELRILLLHGLLHCLGYDHETDDGAMERRERRLRRVWTADV